MPWQSSIAAVTQAFQPVNENSQPAKAELQPYLSAPIFDPSTPLLILAEKEIMVGHEVFQSLQRGELLLVKQANKMALLGKYDSPQYREFALKYKAYIEGHVLLLAEVGSLSLFLKKVPDLAWDLIEFSEKELEIIFSEGRNVPDYFLASDGNLAIRTIVQGNFHKLLFNLSRPLGLIKLSTSFPQDEFLKAYDKMLNLPDNLEWKLKPGKVMELGLSGEIRFHNE